MNKDKLWPLGITLFLIGMVVGTIIFVIFVTDLHFDLVEVDYYQQGLAYQQRIDRINNSNALSEKVKIQIAAADTLMIDFPDEINHKIIEGQVVFFRPDDRSKDDTLTVVTDSTGRQAINLRGYKKGNWKIQLFWNTDSVDYYDEASVYIK
jgi:hypothetical protein